MFNKPNGSNASKDANNAKSSDTNQDKGMDMDGLLGMTGMLGGFSQLIQQLGNLAEKGEQLKRSSQSDSSDPAKKMAGSFGYSVKFGGESFGGNRSTESFSSDASSTQDHATPKATVRQAGQGEAARARPVQSVREPIVDTYSETDHFLIVAEMPGVSKDNIELQFSEGVMHLIGLSTSTRYEKAISIPENALHENVTVITNNGMVEIRLPLAEVS